MKKTNKKITQWQHNEDKAIAMTDKFIAIIEKLDCLNGWETIIMERIISKKLDDSGLSNKVDFSNIIDMLEYNFGFRILKGNSLAEDMKIEQFITQLKENPYQLTLVA